jgi:hypothetical protein
VALVEALSKHIGCLHVLGETFNRHTPLTFHSDGHKDSLHIKMEICFYDTLETAAKNYAMHTVPEIFRQLNITDGNFILT